MGFREPTYVGHRAERPATRLLAVKIILTILNNHDHPDHFLSHHNLVVPSSGPPSLLSMASCTASALVVNSSAVKVTRRGTWSTDIFTLSLLSRL